MLLCANGYVLASAAQDLVALGLDIPGDVDLAGMDDAGPFDVLPLTVAAVSLPSREMGERAMRLLHQRIADPRPRWPPRCSPPETDRPAGDSHRAPLLSRSICTVISKRREHVH